MRTKTTTRRKNHCAASFLTALVILSSATTGAFAFTPLHTSSQLPITSSRSATVVQRYRVENDIPQPDDHRKKFNTSEISQQQSNKDVFSLLPDRMSSVQRLATPSEFQTQVVDDETESLVVVRFYADTCPSCRATRSVFRKWSRAISSSSSDSDSSESTMPIKVLEMPLTKATSTFLQDELQVDQIPYCHHTILTMVLSKSN